jgi:hypothetical protein
MDFEIAEKIAYEELTRFSVRAIWKNRENFRPHNWKAIGRCGVSLPETPNSPEKVVERCRSVVTGAGGWGCPFAVYSIAMSPSSRDEDPSDYKGFWLA